jgi:hypothetical protein
MEHLSEDARALLRAAREIHAERNRSQTFTLGTHLPLERNWSTRVLSIGTRVRDTPGETSTTSSPNGAWRYCTNSARGPAPRSLRSGPTREAPG